MFQRIVYTVLIDRGRHIASCIHDFLRRITHCDSVPDVAEHLDIITAVAKSHTFIQSDMKILQHLVDAYPFAASKRYDIRKQRVPARRFAMGQDFHDALLLVRRKKSDQLVDRLSYYILDRADGRSGKVQQVEHIVYRFIRIVHKDLVFLYECTGKLTFLFLIANQGFNILDRKSVV